MFVQHAAAEFLGLGAWISFFFYEARWFEQCWLWHLFNFWFLQGSREQLAIAEFARSLLVIPKTLAVNAAQDSTDLVAKLRAFHNEAQVNPERKNLKWWVFP